MGWETGSEYFVDGEDEGVFSFCNRRGRPKVRAIFASCLKPGFTRKSSKRFTRDK